MIQPAPPRFGSPRLDAYWRLMRFDKPIGIFLLLRIILKLADGKEKEAEFLRARKL
jgi:hypothetical protein